MSVGNQDDTGKRVKNIAAVLYLLVLVFVVVGSYISQQGQKNDQDRQTPVAGLKGE
jgi:hypothetical protein